jgi:xanthine dehydrogenase accessory factor
MYYDIYREIVRLAEAGKDAAIATVVTVSGSTPREEGAKMLVYGDGHTLGTVGGGNIERQVTREALEVIETGKAKKLAYKLDRTGELGMICGGDTEVFIEPVTSATRLYIFGAGHIAVPLSKMASLIDFKVVVIDDRPDFATPERFPDAAELMTSSFGESYEKLQIRPGSYIVIVTHGHKGDEMVLGGALKTPADYIGMIGSKSKNTAVFAHLLEKGFTQADLDRVHAPIGLRIHAQTPEEIAVSILAEMIQFRREPRVEAGTKSV